LVKCRKIFISEIIGGCAMKKKYEEPIVALYMLSAIDVLTLSQEEQITDDLWNGMDI
jgi:hypothetical protein